MKRPPDDRHCRRCNRHRPWSATIGSIVAMMTVLAAPGSCRALPEQQRGIRPGRGGGRRPRRSHSDGGTGNERDSAPLRGASPRKSSGASFSDPTMENSMAEAPDDVGGDDDDDDDIDDACAHRRSLGGRHRGPEARHFLASFAIIAVEWIRTYVPIHAAAAKLKRMHDCLNDRSGGDRWGGCGGGGGSAIALGRPSCDGGTAGDAAGKCRSRFPLRFEAKRRAPTPSRSISTTSTRPRVDAGQILTRLEGRESSSILFASDGTKAKAPMEILKSSRMSRFRERGKDDD